MRVSDPQSIQAWVPGEPWRRLLATTVDLLLFLPVAGLAVPATELALVWQNPAPLLGLNLLWWTINLFLIVQWRGTPGKRLLGLQILRVDGRGPGWLDAINRQILYIGLSAASLLHQGTLLATLPSDTGLESYLELVTQNQSSWAWTGDLGLALLWASCLLVLLRADRRSLYDLWSGTIVVRPLRPRPAVAGSPAAPKV